MAYTARIENAATGALITTLTADVFEFEHSGFRYLDEANDKWWMYGQGYEAFLGIPLRFKVSPTGIAWSSTGGQGGRSISLTFFNDNTFAATTTQQWDQVDNVDLSLAGWCIITIGDHLIAYTTTYLTDVTFFPAP